MAGRILIVEGVAVNRILLRSRLHGACHETEVAADGATGLALARRRPDLILLDSALPDLSPGDFLARLRAIPGGAGLPVIVMADRPDDAARIAAFSAGADDILPKSSDEFSLLARVRNLLRARAELPEVEGLPGLAEGGAAFDRPALVGLVTARPESAMRLRKDIGAHLSDRLCAMTRADLLGDRAAGDPLPDAIVVEVDLDSPDAGLRLVSELRSHPKTRHVAIAAILPPDRLGSAAFAYDVGVNDLWPAGLGGQEAALRLRRLIARKRDSDQARLSVEDRLRLAHVDPLTGLHNRRYALPRLAEMASRARADGRPFAVMVVDLDRFKTVNDRHGHAAGDAVLAEVAHRLTALAGPGALTARIGGEEFLLAVPVADVTEAERIAASLCRAVEAAPVRLADGTQLQVTASVGLALGGGPGEAAEAVMDRADRALLTAKSSGRNQVTVGRSAA